MPVILRCGGRVLHGQVRARFGGEFEPEFLPGEFSFSVPVCQCQFQVTCVQGLSVCRSPKVGSGSESRSSSWRYGLFNLKNIIPGRPDGGHRGPLPRNWPRDDPAQTGFEHDWEVKGRSRDCFPKMHTKCRLIFAFLLFHFSETQCFSLHSTHTLSRQSPMHWQSRARTPATSFCMTGANVWTEVKRRDLLFSVAAFSSLLVHPQVSFADMTLETFKRAYYRYVPRIEAG